MRTLPEALPALAGMPLAIGVLFSIAAAVPILLTTYIPGRRPPSRSVSRKSPHQDKLSANQSQANFRATSPVAADVTHYKNKSYENQWVFLSTYISLCSKISYGNYWF
jgi:hypothetical protein